MKIINVNHVKTKIVRFANFKEIVARNVKKIESFKIIFAKKNNLSSLIQPKNRLNVLKNEKEILSVMRFATIRKINLMEETAFKKNIQSVLTK